MLTEENKKALKEMENSPFDKLIDEMFTKPPFEASERYRKICHDGYNPASRVDFKEMIKDGKSYIGGEILDYYAEQMKNMTWPEKVAYAAQEKGFHKCSVKEYQDITDMEFPENLESIFIRKRDHIASEIRFLEYYFLFGCSDAAYYYYMITATKDNRIVCEDDELLKNNDVFRRLEMLRGKIMG